MNSKQLFFISLIILSVVMGLNWFKNKPKFVKKQPSKSRQAVNLSDLQLQDEKNEASKKNSANNDSEEEEEENGFDEENNEEEQGSDTDNPQAGESKSSEQNPEGNQSEETGMDNQPADGDNTASSTVAVDNPLKDDPIMAEYFKQTRNPFETSPYAQLVEKLRLDAELAAKLEAEEKAKANRAKIPPKQISAKFTGTIETQRGTTAIIDNNFYSKGDEFKGAKIKKIYFNKIELEDDKGQLYVIGKVGVKITINNEDATYTIDDTFEEE